MITNEHYYRALNVMDKIEEIRVKKGIAGYKIGKFLGHTPSYYYTAYDNCRTIKVSTLIKLAKSLDISVEYLLSGKNKEEFKPFEFNLDIIKNTKVKYLPNRLRVIKCRIVKNKANNISLKTLFEFEHYLKISAIKIIGG